MSTNFPTSLDSYTNPISTNNLSSPDHAAQHSNENDAIVALETKIGVDSSAVTTTLDYKVKNSASVDPGHKHTTASISVSGLTSSQLIRTNAGGTALESSGKTVPTGSIVGDTDTQTLTNKTIAAGSNTISGITEAMQSLSDLTTANVSITAHGYAPKAPNDSTKFLRGDATWATVGSTIFTKVNSSVTSYTMSTASGNQVIAHGMAIAPKLVKFSVIWLPTATLRVSSTGSYNGSSNVAIFDDYLAGSSTSGDTGSACIFLSDTSGNTQSATATVDATNITLAWTKTNTPSGTAYITWEAIG